MSYTYKYPRPMVTVDAVIFKLLNNNLQVLLIKRKKQPYKDMWALPGGFIDMDETLDEAAKRELKEETGLSDISLKQFYTFGDPGRDPRGRTISIAYYSILNKDIKIKAGDDAKEVQWFNINNLPPLAFDHHKIIEKAVEIINNKSSLFKIS
ncbi:MAG: hypothetical protein Kow0068_23970 [Marinilabiliales bacterium]